MADLRIDQLINLRGANRQPSQWAKRCSNQRNKQSMNQRTYVSISEAHNGGFDRLSLFWLARRRRVYLVAVLLSCLFLSPDVIYSSNLGDGEKLIMRAENPYRTRGYFNYPLLRYPLKLTHITRSISLSKLMRIMRFTHFLIKYFLKYAHIRRAGIYLLTKWHLVTGRLK